MSKVEVYTSSEALLWFVLSRLGDEEDTDRSDAFELVRATSEFCGDWISPLTAAVRVVSCDPANHYVEDSSRAPARPAWFLRRSTLDARLYVGPVWIDSQERESDLIGPEALLAVVDEALGQPPPSWDLEVALSEVVIDATEVALPPGIDVSLQYGGRPIDAVQRQAPDGKHHLAAGPTLGPAGPPVRLRASNSHGRTDLHVEFCWDFWREHPAGSAQVRVAIARVLGRGRGWQITEGNLLLG